MVGGRPAVTTFHVSGRRNPNSRAPKNVTATVAIGCTRRHRTSALCATFKLSPLHARHARGVHVRKDVHGPGAQIPHLCMPIPCSCSLALARSFRRPPCDCSTGSRRLSSVGTIVVVRGGRIVFIVQTMKQKEKQMTECIRAQQEDRDVAFVDPARLDNNATQH
jgi:hypothetical protein